MVNPRPDALKQAVAAPENDPQRKTRRYPYREQVGFQKPYEFEGATVDIGAGGVGVDVPLPIAVGVAVVMEIFQGHAIAQGKVRWGRAHPDGYRVGIQFQDEDWSIIARVQALRGLQA
jgi:hypothetical protein